MLLSTVQVGMYALYVDHSLRYLVGDFLYCAAWKWCSHAHTPSTPLCEFHGPIVHGQIHIHTFTIQTINEFEMCLEMMTKALAHTTQIHMHWKKYITLRECHKFATQDVAQPIDRFSWKWKCSIVTNTSPQTHSLEQDTASGRSWLSLPSCDFHDPTWAHGDIMTWSTCLFSTQNHRLRHYNITMQKGMTYWHLLCWYISAQSCTLKMKETELRMY